MNREALAKSVLIGLFFAPVAALADGGELVTVTTLHDVLDFGGARQLGDLPGPDGKVSFREAVTAVNNTAGPQTVEFAIPVSEFWLDTSVALLEIEQGAISITDDETVIDFASQTVNVGDTNPNGAEVGFYGLEPNGWGIAAMFLSADHCTIKGMGPVYLRGYGVSISGNYNRVIGCESAGALYSAVYINGDFFGTGEPAVGNIVGGLLPGEGNTLSGGNTGVRIDAPAEFNVVIGNVLTGSFSAAEIRGSIYSTTANFNRIGGPTEAERNILAGAGHFGEEGFPVGEMITVEYAIGTIVEGNFIGTTADGLAAETQIGTAGVDVYNADDTVIRNNLISGILVEGYDHYEGQLFGTGINVSGASSGTIITGNLIGTDVTGLAAIPNHKGIDISPFLFNEVPGPATIGGDAGELGNLIAFNDLDGVLIGGTVSGVAIRGNQIHSNGELGIDLLRPSGLGGVSTNDVGDPDNGANKLQNFPVIEHAVGQGSQVTVGGTLNSTPTTEYALDFFANTACDPTGFGEGERVLGSVVVTTDAAGNAAFEVTLSSSIFEGEWVTATATDLAAGNTSEFSSCFAATITPGTACSGDANADGVVDPLDSGYVQARLGCAVGAGDLACDAADVNVDLVVDPLDVGFVLARFGTPCSDG